MWTDWNFNGAISSQVCLHEAPFFMEEIMKIQLSESYIMKNRMQRDTLSQKHLICLRDKCAPPKYNYSSQVYCWNERVSLCFLKGSLTVETALVVPFFLMILLAFFSFFSQIKSTLVPFKCLYYPITTSKINIIINPKPNIIVPI